MRTLIAALALAPVLAIAQVRRLDDQLPAWAAKPWASVSSAVGLEIFGAINPFFQRGDFDGDGHADLAILVREKATGKIGILFLHRKGGRVLLGAGHAFGNGGDDFAWMDLWSVEDRGPGREDRGDPAPRSRIDALIVAKEGSASALIRYRNGKYTWQQQGD
jgi:hypothetical protein